MFDFFFFFFFFAVLNEIIEFVNVTSRINTASKNIIRHRSKLHHRVQELQRLRQDNSTRYVKQNETSDSQHNTVKNDTVTLAMKTVTTNPSAISLSAINKFEVPSMICQTRLLKLFDESSLKSTIGNNNINIDLIIQQKYQFALQIKIVDTKPGTYTRVNQAVSNLIFGSVVDNGRNNQDITICIESILLAMEHASESGYLAETLSHAITNSLPETTTCTLFIIVPENFKDVFADHDVVLTYQEMILPDTQLGKPQIRFVDKLTHEM